MKHFFVMFALLALAPIAALASVRPIELHQMLVLSAARTVALTLDACGGGFDTDLVRFLIAQRIPATVFATRKWIARNPAGVALLIAHPELFQIEDHGAEHVPAVIGRGRSVYGIPGNPDLAHLEHEVRAGAEAVAAATGIAPRWYRGATAAYDPQALAAIAAMGYRVAGFSVNADAGATLGRGAIAARLKEVKPGDIIIAHMNKPASDTAEGLFDGLKVLLARGFRFVKLGELDVRPANRPKTA
jgi:peptidoglycan/xylan/chitin deacetylase (PgdA/CDA1 family)